VGPLLSTRPGERVAGRRLAIAAFAAYLGMAAYSSALTLRWAQVRPAERGSDLERFRSAVRDEPILYLGRDDWAPWELRGAHLWGFQRSRSGSATSLSARHAKTEGDSDPPAVDIDSVDAGTLDDYRYLVTPRTAYASMPPANFRLVERTPWHLLWERRGETSLRWTLQEGEAPGAVLDCRTEVGRIISRQRGRAMVRARPLLGRVGDWTTPAGNPPGGPGAVRGGERLEQRLRLPPGAWELSLRWFSSVPLKVRTGPLQRTLPAYLSDRSTFARLGVVRGHGRPITIEVQVPKRRRIALVRTALLGSVVAVRVDAPPRLIPLARACGRYVDFILPRGPR
jgi:hypothetical protein